MRRLWSHTFFVITLLLVCFLLNGLLLTRALVMPAGGRTPQSVSLIFGYDAVTVVQVFFFASTVLCLAVLTFFLKSKIFKPLMELDRLLTDLQVSREQYPILDTSSSSPSLFNVIRSLEHHIRHLQEIDRARADFLNMASHELRTPLTSIRGSLRLLTSSIEGQFDANNLKLLRIAEEEADRLIRMTTNLLDLAKIEAKERSLRTEWADISRSTREIVEMMKRHHEDHGVSLQVEQMENSIEVMVDPDALKQILMNLISNAIKYSPKNGVVFVHFEPRPDAGLFVKVSDQGCGIPNHDRHLIFEKFRQSSNATKSHVRGTGLGLNIVKALVEQLNGHVGVESEPGQGSTFYFVLPKWRVAKNNRPGKYVA